ncbi:DUF305 domain-containing protein [Segeticoccus rhizosphaerae]|uniref:DUF305 domain-containing protein n=1 Tax=Segeticoccus rhizosphaerae TaxID=1104777 RepID=UPI0010C0B5DC|nr:DUF305 domain-containing protein [Ornithinicoccus soli]
MSGRTPAEQNQPAKRSLGSRLEAALIAAVVAVLALGTAGLFGYGLADKESPPSDAGAEAGFARDMQTHHNQAVQMALIIRPKTGDPTLKAVAYDIITSQQQQSGQMFAWLNLWGLPQTSPRPAMAWMTDGTGGHDMGAMPGGTGQTSDGSEASPQSPEATQRMPGMASPADLARLKSATGKDAEILFLRLMIAHHRAGIAMAQAIQPLTDRPQVLDLARAMAGAQQAEIEQMQQLLRQRGVAP